jgi:hypothetical protein
VPTSPKQILLTIALLPAVCQASYMSLPVLKEPTDLIRCHRTASTAWIRAKVRISGICPSAANARISLMEVEPPGASLKIGIFLGL